MKYAVTYQEWSECALELDRVMGLEAWKSDKTSRHYNYDLIQQRLNHLRNCRAANNIPQLVYSLREGLQRNLGNLANPVLYSYTSIGTKYLIDAYIKEVASLLDFLCDHDFKNFDFQQKKKFFEETAQNFGRSALLLSGGASFGFYHIGVIKALWEHGLVPRVLSGSSAGSVVTIILGTFTDEEIGEVIANPEIFAAQAWQYLNPWQMFTKRSLMDPAQLQKYMLKTIGNYTFQEAYDRTQRLINVTVSPVGQYEQPRLLNYLTAPHLLVWSASMASCAVPGLFPSVTLTAKDRYGNKIPYMASMKWVDGSLTNDLPVARLGELYNVNHHIVSQVNPHIVPFIKDSTSYKRGILNRLRKLVLSEVQHRSQQVLGLLNPSQEGDVLGQLAHHMNAILVQNYHGDITISPHIKPHTYLKLLANATEKDIHNFVLAGERATWPKISMIRNQTKIGQTLERCVRRLEEQENKNSVPFNHR